MGRVKRIRYGKLRQWAARRRQHWKQALGIFTEDSWNTLFRGNPVMDACFLAYDKTHPSAFVPLKKAPLHSREKQLIRWSGINKYPPPPDGFAAHEFALGHFCDTRPETYQRTLPRDIFRMIMDYVVPPDSHICKNNGRVSL